MDRQAGVVAIEVTTISIIASIRGDETNSKPLDPGIMNGAIVPGSRPGFTFQGFADTARQ